MHYGRSTIWQRQCDALGNALLGNLGSGPSCRCYFDIYHLPKHCSKPCTPLHGKGISFEKANTHCHTAQIRNNFRNMTRVQSVDLTSRFSRSQSDHSSMGCIGKRNPIHAGPTSQLKILNPFLQNDVTVLYVMFSSHLPEHYIKVHQSDGNGSEAELVPSHVS